MKANLITVKNKPYYIVVLRWSDIETGERKTKWVTSEVPVAGNNKRKAEEKRLEILEEYRYLETMTESQGLGSDILFVDFLEL